MEGRTVHALHHGLPLCNFSSDMPVNWPPMHAWTSPKDIKNINCASCKREAEKMAEQTGK